VELKDVVELAARYGIAVVLCFIVIGILVWVLRWVFRTSAHREEALANIVNVGLANLTTSMNKLSDSISANTAMIQAVGKEMKEGFERMNEAAKYQREEHKEMLSSIKDSCKAE